MRNRDIIRKMEKLKNTCIYGAGTMGRAVLKCLTEEPYNLSVRCFIVKSMSDNSSIIEGIPVIDIEHASKYRKCTILIALNSKLIQNVINELTKAGFTNLIPISFDGDVWTAIRGNWFKANRVLHDEVKHLSEIVSKKNYLLDESDRLLQRLHIYVAHSIYDRQLKEKPCEYSYEINIQVGAALTNKVIYDVRDSLGHDSISEKNRQYCELTGLYWVWKNDKSDYIGFSHYRRKFVLSEQHIESIVKDRIDVVVTEPMVNFATVRGQYAKDHIIEDWDVLISVIAESNPEYLNAAKQIQDGIYYFAYNMFIMKYEILNEYCNFIFPILKRCEEIIGTKDDIYQNRYIGFLGERLLSIFLEKNENLKVAIADKTFLE